MLVIWLWLGSCPKIQAIHLDLHIFLPDISTWEKTVNCSGFYNLCFEYYRNACFKNFLTVPQICVEIHCLLIQISRLNDITKLQSARQIHSWARIIKESWSYWHRRCCSIVFLHSAFPPQLLFVFFITKVLLIQAHYLENWQDK